MATSPSNLPERPASAGSSPKSFPMTSIPIVTANIANGHVNSMANYDHPSTTVTPSQEDHPSRLSNGSSSAKFTLVRASEAYPRPSTVPQSNGLSHGNDALSNLALSGPNVGSASGAMEADVICNGVNQLPFEEIPGEWTTRMAKTRDGRVVLSNYRLHVSIDPENNSENKGGQSWVNYGIGMNVPLGCIESAEQRDLFFLDVYCKDGRYYRIRFDDNSSCEEWQKYVHENISPPNKIQDVFAFGHRAWAEEQGFEELANFSRRIRHATDVSSVTEGSSTNGHLQEGQEETDGYEPTTGILSSHIIFHPANSNWFRSEINRLKFDVHGAWRTSLANKEHKLCPTYPPEILVPAFISDGELEKCASFRSAKRLPAVVWRHTENGACLARCSQPEVGWLGWRSTNDENLVKAIADACAFDRAAAGSNKKIFKSNSTKLPSESDSNISHPSSSLSTMSNEKDNSSLGDVTVSNGNELNGNGDIPSLKDLSAEAAAVIDAVNGDPDKSHLKKVLIMDARSYAAAVGNRARGGGVECPEYYPNAEITFMNLANIHTIRQSHQRLRILLHSQPETTSATWFSQLDATKWLHHLSGLFKASLKTCTALHHEQRPVIVHCSDGWDRTPQIVALSELMLDPYYRSIDGFQVLVEKEWLDFGHKMGDRCGNAFSTSDVNERSPIFLQWLDCVHQLLLQFPCHFEFNLSFLVKLAHHTYSSLFGTFLCNSASERKEHRVHEQTRSVWNFLKHHPHKFCNLLYTPPTSTTGNHESNVLWPRSELRDMLVWTDVYMSEQRQGGSSLGQQQTSNGHTREGTAKVRSSSANGLTQGNATQPRNNCRSGCVSSDQIDSGAASSRDGSEIYDGELKSRDIIEELEKLHVNGSSVPPSSASDRVPKVCCTRESPASNQIPPMNQGISNIELSSESRITNRANSVPACSDITSKRIVGINEKSTDTLVPDCDIEERSSKFKVGQTQSESTKNLSNGITSELSSLGEKPTSISPSKDNLFIESSEERNSHLKQISCTDTTCNHSPNTNNPLLKKHQPLCHQNLSSSTANQPQSGCNVTLNATCCSSDDFSTEDEDGLGNGIDTAYSSRHYTSSQNSTSQNMLLELETYSLYDSDGLLSHNNGVQRRLVSIFATHKKQVNHLKRDLYLTRMALCRSKLAHHNHHCPQNSNQNNHSNLCNGGLDGITNGGRQTINGNGVGASGNGVNGGTHSGGCASSVQSDASSWEAVDEKETKPTLWVPDHAVSCCMRCRTQFWFGRRKHHCRNCGQLFCSECSDNLAPIPSEQLYHPVRICDDCFQKLYPEEAAKKAAAAAEMNAAKPDTIEMNFCQKPNVNESTHQPNGINTATSHHPALEQPLILQKVSSSHCQVSSTENDEIDVNTIPQNDNNSVLPISDIKNVVTPCTTTTKGNDVLEGEACVVLNGSNSSTQ